jgi:PAS domain S-box-containing protein
MPERTKQKQTRTTKKPADIEHRLAQCEAVIAGIQDGLTVFFNDATSYKQVEEALRESQDALRRSHDELEERVRERTAELSRANEQLGAEIADRRRAEEAVQNERQRLHDVLEMLPAYVVLLTPDHHVPFANRLFRERFGESCGRCCFEYLFGRSGPCENCETYKVLETNTPLHWEWTGPDGRNYDIFDFPFTDAGGSPLIMEMGIDITERKREEEALKEANETLEQRVAERTAELHESREDLSRAQVVAHTGSWRMDTRSNVLLWSDETYRIFGLAQGTPMTYETFLAVVHPDDRQYVDQQWTAALRGEPYDVEHRIVVGDAVKWVRERAELEFDSEGVLLGGFGTVQDITERKHAEEALRRSEERYRRLFDEDLTGDFLARADGKVIECNPAFAEIYGFADREQAGQCDLSRFNPADWADLMARLRAECSVQGHQCVHRRPDGLESHVVANVIGRFNEAAELTEVQGYLYDDTEHKRAEEALWELNATLESKVTQRTAELEYRARQLQRLTLELSDAEDRERKHLAEILHDDLQQILAAAKFHLNVLRSRAKYDPSVQATAAQVDHMLKTAPSEELLAAVRGKR